MLNQIFLDCQRSCILIHSDKNVELQRRVPSHRVSTFPHSPKRDTRSPRMLCWMTIYESMNSTSSTFKPVVSWLHFWESATKGVMSSWLLLLQSVVNLRCTCRDRKWFANLFWECSEMKCICRDSKGFCQLVYLCKEMRVGDWVQPTFYTWTFAASLDFSH